MPHPLHNSAALYQHLKAELLKLYPELSEDEQALLDNMEGLSDINEMIASFIRSAIEDEHLAFALGTRIETMKGRFNRLTMRAKNKRNLVAQVMAEIGVKKIASDDFTLSQGYSQPSVLITDETTIPAEYWREKVIREPDKSSIKDRLRAGASVPGTMLSNPQPMLTVRVN